MKINYKIINQALNLVTKLSGLYNIDESHSLRHSLDVFHNACEIYQNEIFTSPFLKQQQNEIFCSAILHDMCDKKYTDQSSALKLINFNMQNYLNSEEMDIMNNIVTQMSYSHVKENGYPNLENFNLAFHIVREADLLAAYDVERCFVYKMKNEKNSYETTYPDVISLFENRILKYIDDELFVTDYSKSKARKLHDSAAQRLDEIKKINSLF